MTGRGPGLWTGGSKEGVGWDPREVVDCRKDVRGGAYDEGLREDLWTSRPCRAPWSVVNEARLDVKPVQRSRHTRPRDRTPTV